MDHSIEPSVKGVVTVGLLWHSFQSGNLGVSALTDANMSLVREAVGDRPLRLIAFGPRGGGGFSPPAEWATTEFVAAGGVRDMPQVVRALRQCDLVLDIGSGDSFADIYGWKRLFKIAGLKIVAAIVGRRAVLSPQTIGPFRTPMARLLGTLAMRLAPKIFARDSLSLARARDLLGADGDQVELTTDVAFALPKLPSWPPEFPELSEGVTHIGLNVSGLLMQGGYTETNQFSLSLDYPQLIRSLIEELTKRPNVKVWLVPHVYQITSPNLESDRSACETLAIEFPATQMAPLFYNAREAKTFLAAMDLVMAARMHAAIGAVSSGVACIPMSYSVKFQGLFESINYPYTIDLKSETQVNALKRLLRAVDDMDMMQTQAEASASLAQVKLNCYRRYLATALRGKSV